MPVPVSHHAGRASADSALARALRQDGAARREELAALSQRYPEHGPIWLALAEEHLTKRRREEARYAAKRALRIDGSLARHFSPELAHECASMMPPDRRAGRGSAAFSAALSDDARRALAVRERIHNQGDADIELAQAKRLPGLSRCERLEALSQRFASHAPVWLALAEDYLAQRRIDDAMDAYQRALALDPEQSRFASPKLETAHRYYDRAAPPRHQMPGPAHDSHESLRALQERAASSVQVPRSNPSDRTKYLPYSQVQRPEGKTIPPYLRTPSGSHRPAAIPSQHHQVPRNVGQELEQALEEPTPAARLRALRELEAVAPMHAGVLFHLAIQAVMIGNLDEARTAGQTLSRVNPRRYRQLYEWADEWAKSAHQVEPQHDVGAVREHREMASNARTLCLELPQPHAGRSVPMPAIQSGQHGQSGRHGQVYKTQLLPVPAGILAQGSSGISAPHAAHVSGPIATGSTVSTSRSAFGRRMRTAGALIAGVAAGLLVAMLLVFVVNSAGSLESSGDDERARPTLVQERTQTDHDDTASERPVAGGVSMNDDTPSAGASAGSTP